MLDPFHALPSLSFAYSCMGDTCVACLPLCLTLPQQPAPKCGLSQQSWCPAVMCLYSALFMRFALAIQPKNYLLFACHVCNEAVQLNQARRIYRVRDWRTVSRQPWPTLLQQPCITASSILAGPGRFLH